MRYLGGNKKFTRRMWLDFAETCKIPKRAADRLLETQVSVLDESLATVYSSFLPEKHRESYEKILREHTAVLLAKGS